MMSETKLQGGPEMVRIDGARIRALREQQGLTQLYIATAVDVTTDTVSRWENKRYPTIKKENCLRLAAALEVDLEELLDNEPPAKTEGAVEAEDPPAEASGITVQPNPSRPGRSVSRTKVLAVIICFAAICTMALIAFFYLKQEQPIAITVERIVAPHFVAGQPLPVFIQVSVPQGQTRSIVLTETLPPGTSLASSNPPVSGGTEKDKTLKWLSRIDGQTTFSYTVVTDPSFRGSLRFKGTFRMTGTTGEALVTPGETTSVSGYHHWADTDGDNRISDEEILLVYDLASANPAIAIDMDLVEEIWLGDGYTWKEDDQRFVIIE